MTAVREWITHEPEALYEAIRHDGCIPCVDCWERLVETLDAARAAGYEDQVAPLLDVLNQELRENGPADVKQAAITDDLRPFLRQLVDAVRLRARAEGVAEGKSGWDQVAYDQGFIRGEAEGARAAMEGAHYWLLRAYHSGHREGWEDSPSVRETMDGIHSYLCDRGLDPNTPATAAWLRAQARPTGGPATEDGR